MARKPTELRPLMLRIPEGLRKRLEVEASKNDRSMNSEIIHRLQESFQKEDRAQLIAEAVAESAANTVDLLLNPEWDPDGSLMNEWLRKRMRELSTAARKRGKGTP